MKKTILFFLCLNLLLIGQAQVTKTVNIDPYNKGKIKFVYSTTANKKANVIALRTLSPDSITLKTIKGTQDVVSKTINITTAGTLSMALTFTELSTVTDLTVTGIIDSRDFKTMNNMPMLSLLDIKDVKIAAYSGPGGTTDLYPNFLANVIPMGAFYSNKNITSIIIPSSATSMDYWAFSNFNGDINADVNSVYFSSLDGVLYDKNKTKMFRCPISKKGILTLPSTVTYIGHSAFEDCKDLTSIIFPASLTYIDRYAFIRCTGLTSFKIPALVSFIGEQISGGYKERMFEITVDPDNQYFSSLDNVLFDKNKTKLLMCSALKTGSYAIPSTVTSINQFAFDYCQSLTAISIPQSVTTIGQYAFSMCSKLTGTLTIFSSITKIEDFAFFGCDFTSIILPNTITSIGTWAFMGLDHLTTISIPSSVKYLGSGAIGCSELTSIYANSSVPINIGSSSDDEVFWSTNKTSCKLYVPYATKALYAVANEWKDFSTIIEEANGFSVGITAINLAALAGSNATVNIKANLAWTAISDKTWLTVNPSSGSGDATQTLTAAANPTFPYRIAIVTFSATGKASQIITITQEGALKTINNTAGRLFSNLIANELNTITNLAIIGTIDARDFKFMRDSIPKLAKLDLSRVNIVAYEGTEGTGGSEYSYSYSANTIPQYAFYNKNNLKGKTTLTAVVLPSSLISIDYYAFSDCNGMTSITIPLSVSSIIDYAFKGCSAFITVDTGNPNYSSLDGVLYNKNKTILIYYPISKTGSYTIPSSVTTIGNYAFANCSGFTGTLTIPTSVTTIGFCAFFTCRGLTGTLTIPSSVTTIGGYAFANCNGFTSLIIPTSVTSIASSAFAACQGLTSIYVYPTKPVDLSFAISVFDYVDKTKCTLYVPPGSKSAYQAAFQWMDFNNIIEMKNFVLSSNAVSISPEEGSTATITATSNTTWIASSNQAWLTVSPASGSNYATLIFTAKANPTTFHRTAIVTITPTDASVQTITITQSGAAPSLEVLATSVIVGAAVSSMASVYITSTTTWTTSLDQTWLTVSPTSGSGNSALIFNATANLNTVPRTATLTISGTGVSSKTITVTQATLYILAPTIEKKWNDVLICDNTANQFIGYQWYNNDMAMNDAIKQFYYQPGGLSGSFYVEVLNSKGERGFSNVINISSLQHSKSLNIYPNPALVYKEITLQMNLSNEDLSDSRIKIYSVKGEMIRRIENLQEKMTLQINNQGTYILQLQSKEGIVKETTKFIVNR